MQDTIKKNNHQTLTSSKFNLEGEKLQSGLAKLVLTLIELLRQILERQAQKKVISGTLSEDQVERLGLAFVEINQKVKEISLKLGVKPEELNPNLSGIMSSGTVSKISLVDVIDRLLDKKPVVAGRISIAVADIELIALDLLAELEGSSQDDNDRKNKMERHHD